MMPVVTHTAECFGVRPVAKALGMSVTAMATRGLGMSASAHSRSIMACSSGAWCGSTTWALIDLSASESEKYHCPQAIASTITKPSPPSAVWLRIAANRM